MLKYISKELEIEYNKLISQQVPFYNHSVNVAYYTRVLLNQIKKNSSYNIDESTERYIEMASLLHDIGKTKIPLYILNKSTPLSYLEFDLIKKHSQMGYIIIVEKLGPVAKTKEDMKFVKICKNIALYHHERIDGNGYPYGIKYNKIPLEAQIIAIVDSFDAMTHYRSYNKPFSKEEAIKILVKEGNKYNQNLLKSLEKAKKTLINSA